MRFIPNVNVGFTQLRLTGEKHTGATTAVTATVTERTGRTQRSNRGFRNALKLFLVDMTLLVVFLLVMNVPLTGIAIHEWLGIAIGVAAITHLVQHGDWIATTTKRIIERTSFRNQLNYWMMVALFFGFVTIIVSGVVISEAALPWLGITTKASTFWLWLHLVSVNWVMALTAVHVAMNWKWIASTTVRVYKKLARLPPVASARSSAGSPARPVSK
jgi:hypothetical protein